MGARLRILVLGGTRFLGRHLAEAAMARGHALTLFNRGRTAPGLFPGVETIAGDRDGGLDALAGREWDAAVDTSGFVPRLVGASAAALSGRCGHYTFVSSASVYDLHLSDKREGAPVLQLEDAASEDIQRDYGALKAASEAAATAAFDGPVLAVRSGLITGPWDPTGRFTYWPLRCARGGEVLAPGGPEHPTQMIDARDEAAWILDMAERGAGGVFNVTGPRLAFGDVVAGCARAAGTEVSPTWVPDEFLEAQGVGPWVELPLWIPPSGGSLQMPVDRAMAAGLRTRPVEETARDILAWAREVGAEMAASTAGLAPAREAEVLAAWHARAGGAH